MTAIENQLGAPARPAMNIPPVTKWTMASSNGWRSVSFDAVYHMRPQKSLEYRVSIAGAFWRRSELLADPPVFDELSEDFVMTLPSVIVPVAAVFELAALLGNWLSAASPFSATLCETPDQQLAISLSEPEGTGSSDKPLFNLSYAAAGCELQVYFVVDQSCIRAARDSILRSLNAMGVADDA